MIKSCVSDNATFLYLHADNLRIYAHINCMNNTNKRINIITTSIVLAIAVILMILVSTYLPCAHNAIVCERKSYDMKCISSNADNNMQELSSFTTSFATSTSNRAHNIMLASSKFDGVIVPSGGTITFNQLVGERTYERGYLDANVIMKGVYVKGVGGGICQVSSTIYNAWLLAGLDVVESKAHTLPSSYVDLSRDATVSSEIDLVLANTTDSDILINVNTENNALNISVHGKPRGYEYRLITDILAEVQTYLVPDVVLEVDSVSEVGEEIYEGKSGYKSRLVIEIVDNDVVIARRELRRDNYAATPTQRVRKVLRGTIS